ncbi:MAG: endo-1,4-beta-xylanase [Planctomycetota bacterium]
MEFQVFKNGELVDNFALHGAYLFGTDGIAIRRSQIGFDKGVIRCGKANMETSGLALLWPVEGFGRILLPTTCLPERSRSYILNVELARAKLKQVTNKREDWSFFDSLEALEDMSKQARNLFIEALQNISDPPLASKLADESLKKAMVLSEKLALNQAGSLFETRGKNRGFGRGCLGCRVDPAQITSAKYVEKLTELFGFVTVPISWAQIESRRGLYDFTMVDACINVLGKKKLAICLGPLLRFSPEHLPRWLLGSRGGFERIRDAAYQFVAKIVGRYWSSIHVWRVISGLNAYNHFGFSFEQVLEMTRAANMAVRRASNRTIKIVEVCNPWGEYYAQTPNTIPPLVYVDMVVQSGINFDAFGLQMRFGSDQPGMHVRDMMQMSAVLDYFGSVAKPLYITAVEVPGEEGSGLHSGEVAGIWHQQWDQSRQAEWIEQFYRIALSKPFVDTVTYSNLTDKEDGAVPGSGLLTSDMKPKESFGTLKRLHELIFSRLKQ